MYLDNGAGHQGVAEMGARGNGHQVGAGPLLPVDCCDELVQDVGVLLIFSEAHNINVHLFFLQLLGKLDNFLLV